MLGHRTYLGRGDRCPSFLRRGVTSRQPRAKLVVEMPPDVERSDGELLAAVVAGDGAAFAASYRRHLAGVVGYLVRETGDREVSADLAAEVFAAVFLAAGRFRARGAGSAVPWLRGIAQNKLRESRRRGRVEDRARRRLAMEPELLDDADLARVEELASRGGALELVDRLPERQRFARGCLRAGITARSHGSCGARRWWFASTSVAV
jgi:DNA-directed RNA polymerase specialized sigma24 family protein